MQDLTQDVSLVWDTNKIAFHGTGKYSNIAGFTFEYLESS
jgi:hypothetical protein